jgi:FMN-dependent oxidoreductase (nitrilotriacetate monooxygenase family)
MSHTRTLHLSVFGLSCGHHEGAWRSPGADPLADFHVDFWTRLAVIAEEATFDSVFLADSASLWHDGAFKPVGMMEPTIVLAAMAAATERVGLIVTASTSYNEPYNLARRLSTLDHISNGRVGWNIVTSGDPGSPPQYGLDAPPDHRVRYARASEFVEVSRSLWDSWEDDAINFDKEAGRFLDTDRVHRIDHLGEFFRVRGPLNIPRSPQGHPVLVQAGASRDGQEFAARYADAIFTAEPALAKAVEFYESVKSLVRVAGRDPDAVKVLPGLVPIIGSTEREAQELKERLDNQVSPDYGLQWLATIFDVSVERFELDSRLPGDLVKGDAAAGMQSRTALVVEMGQREDLTVRQLIRRLGGGRGHHTVVGTPEHVADVLEQWFVAGAADGFSIMPAEIPSGFQTFADHVVPLLRRRGLFRNSYTGHTLRDHFGLARPESRYHNARISATT